MFRREKITILPLSLAQPLGLRVLVLLAAGYFVFGVSTVGAQQVAQEGGAAEEEEERVRPTIDLGMFQVKDFRPTRNETAKVTFKIYLALDRTVDEQTVEALEYWKHRLRDQVIIAIRLSQTKDFLEPDLSRLRRFILVRTNRVLKASLVSEALLTEYSFKTD